MMSLDSLKTVVESVLVVLKIKYKVTGTNTSIQFIITDFGTVICCIDKINYSSVNNKLNEIYPGFRKVFIAPDDSFVEKKNEIIWALAGGGYLRWLRFNYPRNFNNFIVTENFGNRIIDERLKRWNNKPMYRSFIDDNLEAKKISFTYILSVDPGFFDYMPEDI